MSKLDPLKEKLAALRGKIAEKTDKIGFLRAWKEKRQKVVAAPTGSDPYSLPSIYRGGSIGTRLQVIAFYGLVLLALVSGVSLARKIALKMRSATGQEQLNNDIAKGLAEVQQKKIDEAELLALGQFTTNIYISPKENGMMSIELWLRVSDPAVAATINRRNEQFREKAIEVLNDLFQRKMSLLTDEGKADAREQVRIALNSVLKEGKVEEVFIQNLVVQ